MMFKKYYTASAGSERYALANPGLTKIKLAENYTRRRVWRLFLRRPSAGPGSLAPQCLRCF